MNIGARVVVIDNSGVRLGKCLCIYRYRRSTRSGIGTTILLVTTLRKRKTLIKLDVMNRGLVVRDNNDEKLLGGHIIRCDNFGVVLLKPNGDFVGNRISQPISFKLRKLGYTRLLSISNYIY